MAAEAALKKYLRIVILSYDFRDSHANTSVAFDVSNGNNTRRGLGIGQTVDLDVGDPAKGLTIMMKPPKTSLIPFGRSHAGIDSVVIPLTTLTNGVAQKLVEECQKGRLTLEVTPKNFGQSQQPQQRGLPQQQQQQQQYAPPPAQPPPPPSNLNMAPTNHQPPPQTQGMYGQQQPPHMGYMQQQQQPLPHQYSNTQPMAPQNQWSQPQPQQQQQQQQQAPQMYHTQPGMGQQQQQAPYGNVSGQAPNGGGGGTVTPPPPGAHHPTPPRPTPSPQPYPNPPQAPATPNQQQYGATYTGGGGGAPSHQAATGGGMGGQQVPPQPSPQPQQQPPPTQPHQQQQQAPQTPPQGCQAPQWHTPQQQPWPQPHFTPNNNANNGYGVPTTPQQGAGGPPYPQQQQQTQPTAPPAPPAAPSIQQPQQQQYPQAIPMQGPPPPAPQQQQQQQQPYQQHQLTPPHYNQTGAAQQQQQGMQQQQHPQQQQQQQGMQSGPQHIQQQQQPQPPPYPPPPPPQQQPPFPPPQQQQQQQQQPPPQQQQPAQVIGGMGPQLGGGKSQRYTIVKKLGAGGQGGVWLVDLHYKGFAYTTSQGSKQHNTTERVALKKIPCHSFEDANMALEEAKFLMKFSCPSIIGYKDFFLEQEGSVFNVCIAMEFCPNGDLLSWTQRNGLPTNETALTWTYDLAAALAYLHSENVIHRDLKPANVFVDATGNLKLGDLGLLRTIHYQEEIIKTKVGTPMYLAPEVLANKDYNEKVDTWALGCMMYTVLTNKLRNINFEIYQTPNLVQELRSDLVAKNFAAPFIEILITLMQPDPEKRPSAEETMARVDALRVNAPPQQQSSNNGQAVNAYMQVPQ